jgi:hypothetical protein
VKSAIVGDVLKIDNVTYLPGSNIFIERLTKSRIIAAGNTHNNLWLYSNISLEVDFNTRSSDS